MKYSIRVEINDEVFHEEVDPRLLLVDFIREVAGLTGTHVGCGVEGRCGACTVMVDGRAAKSCLMLAAQADGRKIRTVEGISRGDELHPIQRAFREKHGLQCGFCTPGFLMTLYDYLSDPACDLSEDGVRRALSGVLCRCTGYVHVVEAVVRAGQLLAELEPGERAAWFQEELGA